MGRVGSIQRMVVKVNHGEANALLEQMERNLEERKRIGAEIAQRHKELMQDLADIRLICTNVCDQLIENGVITGLSDLSADETLQLILDNKQKRLEQEEAEKRKRQQQRHHAAHVHSPSSSISPSSPQPKKDDGPEIEL